MDELESKNFFKYVFQFNDTTKCVLLNIVQYGILSIIPIVALNKTMQRFIPEIDETKSSLEITAEIIIQVIVLFLGIFFIHRVVTFVPTYSKKDYPDFNVVQIILSTLVILFSINS